MKSKELYKKYQNGEFGNESHNNNLMIGSGEYESYPEFLNDLKQLV